MGSHAGGLSWTLELYWYYLYTAVDDCRLLVHNISETHSGLCKCSRGHKCDSNEL